VGRARRDLTVGLPRHMRMGDAGWPTLNALKRLPPTQHLLAGGLVNLRSACCSASLASSSLGAGL
jgi:hypothetical protein